MLLVLLVRKVTLVLLVLVEVLVRLDPREKLVLKVNRVFRVTWEKLVPLETLGLLVRKEILVRQAPSGILVLLGILAPLVIRDR